MTQVVSSLSGIQFYAPSAGYAPTNSGDVSAIASAYQVVSSTGTQLYAGTDYVTGVNGAPLSASRAGNAANASLASSAWYDGTGRLISSLPDGTEVSSIASSYAGSAASSKLDTSAFSSVSGTFLTSVDLTPYQEKTGMSAYALSGDVSSVIDTVSSNSASWAESGVDSATVSAIASSYVESGVSGKLDSSSLGIDDFDHQVSSISGMAISAWHAELAAHADSAEYWRGASGKQDASAMSSYALSSDVSGVIDTVSSNSATWGGGATGDYVEKSAVTLGIGLFNGANGSSLAHGSSNSANNKSFAQGVKNTAWGTSLAQGYENSARDESLAQGWSNNASGTSFAQGQTNRASGVTFAQGLYNSAGDYSFAQGRACSASSTSFAQGRLCSAKDVSLAQGYGVSSMRSATVFGQWNRDGDGWGEKGVAFGIGDGTASGSRHDLMKLQKNGEITVYSSTSDVTGTGILSAIRAISAAATGGGVDSATVSAIASSYVESGVSGKQDISGMSSYALSSDVSGVIDTVSSNSASWGQGGVDSATVSAIASSYVESGVSGKLDSSASSSFYTTANESGFITGVDLSPYQTTADMSGYIPTSMSSDFQQVTGMSSYVPYSSLEYNTASAISGINGSALAAGSTYSAGEGIDITDDVISVEAPVDIVAGPGIVIDNPDGNTLRVSQTEPVVDAVRDCENWNGHTMKCIILRGAYTTNTSMKNQYIENVLPVGTTIAFIDGSNSYVVYGDNPQINMMVPYHIDNNRLFSPWVDITNRRVNLRYIDVSNNITCTYYLCVKYAID